MDSISRLASAAVRIGVQANGRFAVEIIPVAIPQKEGDPIVFAHDEHPRLTSLEALAKLKPVVRADGTATASNASGLNDGAAATLIAPEAAAKRNGLTSRARIVAMAAAGVAPASWGVGPVDAAHKLLNLGGLTMRQIDVIELNEAFASQTIATLRTLDVDPANGRSNRNGGAIALGHPLGMSGARWVKASAFFWKKSK